MEASEFVISPPPAAKAPPCAASSTHTGSVAGYPGLKYVEPGPLVAQLKRQIR
jgi:hypothetical protein